MRYDGDIDTAQELEIKIPRGAAQWLRAWLNDYALCHGFESLSEAFDFYKTLQKKSNKYQQLGASQFLSTSIFCMLENLNGVLNWHFRAVLYSNYFLIQ